MIVEHLKQRQGNLTDAGYAAILGMHRSCWNRIKNGRRELTPAMLLRVWDIYPELAPNRYQVLPQPKLTVYRVLRVLRDIIKRRKARSKGPRFSVGSGGDS